MTKNSLSAIYVAHVLFPYTHAAKAVCVDDGSIPNGHRQMTDSFEGGTITFYCYDGYVLNGVSEAECLSTGQWSASWPTCIRGKQKIHTFECLVFEASGT